MNVGGIKTNVLNGAFTGISKAISNLQVSVKAEPINRPVHCFCENENDKLETS